MLKCTLTEIGERYAYKDKCSHTKQCAFNRFECTLTKLRFMYTANKVKIYKDVCTITMLQFTELNVHLQRCMYT